MKMKWNHRYLLGVLVLFILLGSACGKAPTPTPAPPTAAPTSTAVPPTATSVPATSVPITDNVWSRIQAAGRIVVGTSADYPPFAYYTDDFTVDGFDIALMREMGQRLGVQVEFSDFAFDGLLGALQLEQIDVAIAAISVSPERQAVVDFSNVYYVGEDAILTGQDSTISIRSVADMAGHRVGVQRGSVYESWLKTSLVDTGQMPSGNLFSYVRSEDSIRDLKDQRVDLVVLDYVPAQSFANQGGIKVVGHGFNQQRFALAVPKGATTLQAEINRTLIELSNEGTIAQLAQEYLNLAPPDILPTPTPAPAAPTPTTAPAPAPTPACIDGMALVQDLTYDDKNMTAPPLVAGGQPFVKGWRVRNTGTCTWDNTYSLVYVRGNVPAARMSGEPVAIARTVLSEDTYDIQVNLVAPTPPGVYQGFWYMHNGKGVAFGYTIWVGITVPAGPTATPAPTQTPSPGISFRADRIHIKAGERVVFTWDVENIKAVYFYAKGEPWEKNGVAGHDRRDVYPQTTTTYELRVVKRDNSVETRQIRIKVDPVVGPPVIAWFAVEPEFQILVGQCVNIQWEVRGEVSRVKITRNNVALWDGAPSSGSLQDCPPGVGNVAYAIEASGPGGTSRAQKNINVIEPTATPPRPTGTPQPTGTPPPAPMVNIIEPMDGFVQRLPNPVHFTITALGSVELDRIELWGYIRIGGGADLLQTLDAHGTTQKTASFDWQPAGAGSVSFYAKAYDVAGGEGTSDTINGRIDAPEIPTATPTPVPPPTDTPVPPPTDTPVPPPTDTPVPPPSAVGRWGADAGEGTSFTLMITNQDGGTLDGTLTVWPGEEVGYFSNSTIQDHNVTIHADIVIPGGSPLTYNFMLTLSGDGQHMSGQWSRSDMGMLQPITFDRLLG
jgi:polar amino acid transport system substrate-binding protein